MGWLAAAVLMLAALSVKKMTTTNASKLIKKHEGLKLSRYPDVAGLPTIGYGHKLLPGETFHTITLEKAEELLQADIAKTTRAILPSITRPITDNQKAALVSFAFNVGVTAFKKSTLLRKINAGDMTGAAAEFDRWNKAKINGQLQAVAGLTNRRTDEKNIFIS